MVLRVLGVILGAAFLVGALLMTFIGEVGIIQITTLVTVGAAFLVYGLGGNKALSKVMPWLAK